MWNQPVRRFSLKVGYACNNHCLFCHAAPHHGLDASRQVLLDKIDRAQKMGAEEIVLSGGEPTIRRDLPVLARHIKSLGLSLGLVTNGRMLLYARLTEMLLEAGLDYVQVSLAAGDAEVHDALVGVQGAFHQTTRGILQLLTLAHGPLDLTISCVITRQALPTLDSLADLAIQAADLAQPHQRIRLKASLLEIEGRAMEHARQIFPGIARTARAVEDLAKRRQGQLHDRGVQMVQEGLPPCLSNLPPADLWTEGFSAMSEAFEPDWHPIDDANRRRPPSCIDCSQDGCPGPYATTLDRDDPSVLVPIASTRPSSLPMRPLQTIFLPNLAGADVCPIADRRISPGPPWSLWTRRQRGSTWAWTLWSPVSRDFGPREYRRFLSDLEQVYRQKPVTPSDQSQEQTSRRGPFAGLTPLRRAAICRECPRRMTCLGLFEPTRSPPDPVDRDADLLEDLVWSLSGRVLDVGSGPRPPYLSALDDAIQDGSLRYLAIDPLVSKESSRQAGDDHVQQTTGRAENLMEAARQFGSPDWILSIRSLPHYERPSLFLEQAHRLLSPKGRLLIVSDEPFAVLTTTHPRQAHGNDWQHRRNLSFERLAASLAASGFAVEWSRPAGPDTSNVNFVVARPKGIPMTGTEKESGH